MASVTLLGLELAALTETETIQYVLDERGQGRGGWICTANTDILRQWRHSAEVRELVAGADLVVADGMPLVWASHLEGTPLPERVTGSGLALTLSAAAAAAGESVFLLGGNPGVAEQAADRLIELNPELQVAGTLCPPVGFERDPEWHERIAQTLRDAEPGIVYVALGFPKQERLIADLRAELPGAWFIGCGAALSFVAGDLERAPKLIQRFGLEWLHRLVQEPRRLSRRYLLEGFPFTARLFSSALNEGRREHVWRGFAR